MSTLIRYSSKNSFNKATFSFGIEYTLLLKYRYEDGFYVIHTIYNEGPDYLMTLYRFSCVDPEIYVWKANNFYFSEYKSFPIEPEGYWYNPITEHILSEIFKLKKPLDYALKNVFYNYTHNTNNDYYLDILSEKKIIIEYIKKCIKNYKFDILPENYIFTKDSKLNLIERIKQIFLEKDKLYLIAKMVILVRELKNLIMNI